MFRAFDGYIVIPRRRSAPRTKGNATANGMRSRTVDEISITIAFALLGLTWMTLRGMDGREHRRHRRVERR